MKILLSAYACEPYKGSEPAVGWHWCNELIKKQHETWVLTRSNNQKSIETYFETRPKPSNLFFLYFDLPRWAKIWKKGQQGIRLYYLIWQWFAYKYVKTIHKTEKFECVHHVTFVSARQPSFMGRLGIPFIFGPVAGGEKAPWPLRLSYGRRGIIIDAIRDLGNLLIKFDPMMRATFKQAHKIYVTSLQTKELIPKKFHYKTNIQLAIGYEPPILDKININHLKNKPLKILYMGRFLHWKGMDIGIRAFADLLNSIPDARLTMVGKGREKKPWKNLTNELGISNQVDWVQWVEQKDIQTLFLQHDLFLFPSLHDSGGMVVLESIAHGLPVVCLDLGGPGIIINKNCGKKISTSHKTVKAVIKTISKTILELNSDLTGMQNLKSGAIRRATDFKWNKIVDNIYNELNIDERIV